MTFDPLMSTYDIDKFGELVTTAWARTPAVVVVKQIKRRADLPTWENCEKDHLYVGIIRLKYIDKVVVVKHRMDIVSSMKGRIGKVSYEDAYMLGAIPSNSDMVCSRCGEFSTRMDIGEVCNDCTKDKRDQEG